MTITQEYREALAEWNRFGGVTPSLGEVIAALNRAVAAHDELAAKQVVSVAEAAKEIINAVVVQELEQKRLNRLLMGDSMLTVQETKYANMETKLAILDSTLNDAIPRIVAKTWGLTIKEEQQP